MIPAWHNTGSKDKGGKDVWAPCWLLSTSPHGNVEDRVLISFDDLPHPNWGYPPGSLRIQTANMNTIRLRRTVVPLVGEA